MNARGAVGLAALLLLTSAACTFEDGRGWATLRASAGGTLVVDDAHAPPEGATLVTDLGYALTLSAVTADLGGLELLQAGGGAGAGGPAPFDPAHPPAGYTLCHGGHCHSVDGGLVSYEDIAAELAGGGGASGPIVAQLLEASGTLAFLKGEEVQLGPYEIDTVSLAGAALVLTAVRIEGSVIVEGKTVQLAMTLAPEGSLRASGDVTGALGRGGAGKALLGMVLPFPADGFDGISFANLIKEGDTARIDATHNEAVTELLLGRLAQVSLTVGLATD